MRSIAIFLGLVAAWLAVPQAHAQRERVAGANQPLRSDLGTWYYVSHSDVWVYYTDGRAMGERTLRLGIEALREWTQFFEFKMSTPVRLHLYPDPKYFSDAVASNHRELGGRPYQPVDYYAQNVHGIFSPYNGPWPIEQVPIYYPGTYRGLNEQVRAAVLRAMLLNMFLSQDQRGTVYNRLNLFLPEWFLTGLSAYLGEGWSVRDESMMRSLTAARADQLIDDPTTTNPLARVVQKSFWHALEVEHGTRKIAELVYMMRLTRSVESGFRAVFGYTLESTTAKWRAFCTENYYSAEGQDVRAESNFIPLEKGQETTIAAAANPKLPVVAGITLSRFNRIRLVLYDRRKTSRTVIWGPTPPVLNPALATQQLGIGWSADGKTLAACLPKDKYTILYFYDLKAQQGSFVWLKGLVDWVSHLEWSPDGKHLVLAANRFGQSDIFLFEIRNSRLTQLTRDAYDDLHPAWQPDGKAIFFQSNRDTALVAKDRKPGVGFVRNSYDIYRLNAPFERADTLRRITATPHIDETQPNVGPNGLQYLSDARGLNDLSRHLEGDAPPALMTQYRQGIAQWSRAGKRSLLGLYENGRPRYFLADPLDEGRSYALRRTPYAQRKVKQRAEADQAAVERRLRREERAREAARFDSTLRKLEQPADTLAADTANRRVRFYVFDEDEKPLNRPRRTPGAPRRQLAEVVRETTPELPPVDSIKALRAGPRTYSLNQQAYRTVAFFDPIFGLGMQNEVWAEDPFREYRLSGGFRLFNDLNSHDIWSRYQWLHGRTTYEVGFERQQRLFKVPDFYRFITFNPQLSMGLRIDPWSRVVADVDVLYFERRDINLIDRAIKNNSASTTSLLGGLSYIHDRTRERDHFPVAGWRLQLGGRSHYSITRRDQSFSEVHFDGRAYLPLPAEFNLAFRLSAGAYIGHDRPKYMLGGWTNWMTREWDNKNQLPVEAEHIEQLYFTQFVQPMRSFNLNARNGTHFGLLNAELRYPINRMMPPLLSTRPGYTLLWTVFMDLGTTWREGNPFSQRNPIDVKRIDRPPLNITVRSLKSPFLVGFGTGFRMVLVGYLLHADLGWGIEDGQLTAPRFALSFGKEF